MKKLWPLLAFVGGIGIFALLKRSTSESPTTTTTVRLVPPPRILSALKAASQKHDVPLDILVGVAHNESRFNPTVVSSRGAKGLMQLMPVVIEKYGITDPFDPKQSAMGGARFLATYYRKYGDWKQTLAAYNWGPGNVNQNPEPAQWPPQTQAYVSKALRAVA